ncbi:MAG: UDP-N-acetylmuramoyl-L-alanyl-D-glutamate--2,6-diaminopimelate ligase [Bacteroidota bacterium]|nr:UDP-N-acetylmuramoyl-L-alanyl-D-glutamate--2,6-diaminopimelate ligase [Bacteroidota bacterium]
MNNYAPDINLIDLLQGVVVEHIEGSENQKIHSLELDSREIKQGACFFAIRGAQSDGHKFVRQAIEKGAVCIVHQNPIEKIHQEVSYVRVANTSQAMAIMASNFYDNPSKKMKLIGVTGTNGKTSVATLLYQTFLGMGYSTGLIGTIKIAIEEEIYQANHTTPHSIAINEVLFRMTSRSCEFVFMEVSSHSIDQNRVYNLDFDGMVFTNLSHDHLDYHKTFDHYRDTKQKAFSWLKSSAFALFNRDDKNGKIMVQNAQASKYSYALKSKADFKARLIEQDLKSMLLEINGQQAYFALSGIFNAYNLTAAFATAMLLGKEEDEVVKALTKVFPPKGRFELMEVEKITGIIDFAHTPDALKNVLNNINNIRSKNEQLITILGCGGNRDKSKRPMMGNIAASMSDRVVFTSDNPRNEDPNQIIKDMKKGVMPSDIKKTISVQDREEAIKTAVMLSKPGDIILLAGKGHENFQDIDGVKYDFNDFQLLNQHLKELSNV